MSQNLPVKGLKWLNDLSRFNEDFIKNYNENSDKGIQVNQDCNH